MIYINNVADVYLPGANGKADVRIPAGTPVARPSSEPWLSGAGLVRSHVGVSLTVAPADPAVFDLGAATASNNFTADATDQTLHNNTVVDGQTYTVFGLLSWTDANGSWTVEVAVRGDGTHGSGSTFAIDANTSYAGAATKPIVTGSSVNAKAGTVSVKFDSGKPESNVTYVAFFEPIFVSPALYFNEVDSILIQTSVATKMTMVQVGDVGSDYVSGSTGLTKTIKEFPVGARVGDPCKLTTMKYQDATYPTKVTRIDVVYTTVLAGDL